MVPTQLLTLKRMRTSSMSAILAETKSSENANNNRYEALRAVGISVINVVVDRGGFEPPTS
jgi:hypothetical protein